MFYFLHRSYPVVAMNLEPCTWGQEMRSMAQRELWIIVQKNPKKKPMLLMGIVQIVLVQAGFRTQT